MGHARIETLPQFSPTMIERCGPATSTGWPATMDASPHAASTGSTATIVAPLGACSTVAAASAPTPIGTITTSGGGAPGRRAARRSRRRSSRSRRSPSAGTSMYPGHEVSDTTSTSSVARAAAATTASLYLPSTTSPSRPRSRIASIRAATVPAGRRSAPGIPATRAMRATARPWLPSVAVDQGERAEGASAGAELGEVAPRGLVAEPRREQPVRRPRRTEDLERREAEAGSIRP